MSHLSPARFRLGATSYVYPGDLLHNVRRLAGQVQDVELVLFETPHGESNLPTPGQVLELRAALAAAQMSVTVHLPADLACGLAHAASLAQARRVIDLTAALEPVAWVFHVETAGAGTAPWAESAIRSITSLLPLVQQPQQLALENLESYHPSLLEPIFAALPIARTLDIGHLWKAGLDPWPVIERWLPHSRVVHLHGCEQRPDRTWDHLSLDVLAPAQLDPIAHRLRTFAGVLTLEVFESDFFSSRAALAAALARSLTHAHS